LAIVTGVTVRVPAKLNLQLAVGPPRADGYHDLVTVFHAVSLYDEVTVVPADRDGVAVTGEGADRVPADGDNLALRAVAALRAAGPAGDADPAGVHVTIAKRIPVAAGLAGGSADAAAALVACNELWACGLSQQQLAEIGAKVGSDVSFALLGGTAVGRGRGEQLTPALAPATQYHWVLAFADGQLSTPEVYATLDRLRAAQAGGAAPAPSSARGSAAQSPPGAAQSRAAQPGAAQPRGAQPGAAQPGAAQPGTARSRAAQPGAAPRAAKSGAAKSGAAKSGAAKSGAAKSRTAQSRTPQSPAPGLDAALMSALRSGDATLVGRTLSNDLQPAAVSLFPALRKTLAAGLELGALGALVAGSGPTCVFLASSADRALALAASLAGAGVCRSVARATGPVPGAAIVPSAK
jgi:4-diphosphocytidyl-2-C-methyl-D-erythritol kinase